MYKGPVNFETKHNQISPLTCTPMLYDREPNEGPVTDEGSGDDEGACDSRKEVGISVGAAKNDDSAYDGTDQGNIATSCTIFVIYFYLHVIFCSFYTICIFVLV